MPSFDLNDSLGGNSSENLKVIDNYTPNCSLYVEKLANNVSRIVLDYTETEKIHEFSLPLHEIISNTSRLMFIIYSENRYYDRTENPSHIESNLSSEIYTLRVKQLGNIVKILQFYND